MLGLVLEGGGAKGAYQAGVIKELLESGYSFDGVTGTSIGALNGVMLAQNEFEKSFTIWENMDYSLVLEIEDEYAKKIAEKKLDRNTIKYILGFVKGLLKNRGMDTKKIRDLINQSVDEEKLRASNIEFGIMTVSIDDFKAHPKFVRNIPYGLVADYIMASANFPGFKKMEIGNFRYIDGGFYDNLPINMLGDRGYTDIIAIETASIIPKRKVKGEVYVRYIKPTRSPGRVMNFGRDAVAKSISLGFLDAKRFLNGDSGSLYYINSGKYSQIDFGLMDISEDIINEICSVLGIEPTSKKNHTLEIIGLKLSKLMKKGYHSPVKSFIDFIESLADGYGVEFIRYYTFQELIETTHMAIVANKNDKKNNRRRTFFEKIFYIFAKYYMS